MNEALNAGAGTFGQRKTGQAEKTWWEMHDITYFAPGATITEANLFQSDPTIYRNAKFTDITRAKQIEIKWARVMPVFSFAVRNTSEPVAAQEILFWNYSFLKIEIEGFVYSPIPLASMFCYDVAYQAGSAQLFNRQQPIFEFPEPIKIPVTGDVQFKFSPLSGYSLLASALTNPVLPSGSGLAADNEAFYIAWQFFGTQVRNA